MNRKKTHIGTKNVQSGAAKTLFKCITILYSRKQELFNTLYLSTNLGQLQQSIPFKLFAAKIPSPAYERSGRGRKPF